MPSLQPPAIRRQVAGMFKATPNSPPAVKRVQSQVNRDADKYKKRPK